MSKSELDACLALVRESSKTDYVRSSTGWNERAKKREMRADDLRYIILKKRAHIGSGRQATEKDEQQQGNRRGVLISPPETPPIITAVGGDEDGAMGTVAKELGALGKKKKEEKGKTQAEEEEEDQILAFLSFMLTHESIPPIPVLYIYEIHLSPFLRGGGLGHRLMAWVEGIANRADQLLSSSPSFPSPSTTSSSFISHNKRKRSTDNQTQPQQQQQQQKRSEKGVQKLMLTVFKANEKARRFYRGLGWEVDEDSPEPRRLKGGRVREWEYEIWSKGVGEI